MKVLARTIPTRGTMPTRAPGGNTGSAACAGQATMKTRRTAAANRRRGVMQGLLGCREAVLWSARLRVGRRRSAGTLLAGLLSRQQGRRLLVPVIPEDRWSPQVQAMFSLPALQHASVLFREVRAGTEPSSARG